MDVCVLLSFGGVMSRRKILRTCQITEPEKLEKDNNNLYRIIGIIDDHYIVQTPKGFKKSEN